MPYRRVAPRARNRVATDFSYLPIGTYFSFPPAAQATPDGILGHGGNLSPGMLDSAYRQGVFPWFSEDDPILWWSPDPRFVLFPDRFHMPRSLRRFLRKRPYRFTLDLAFERVIEACATIPRPGQRGTWITAAMIDAYCELHRLGRAHSVEVWRGPDLVGGVYGVAVGALFAGESMFNHADNASKSALAVLCDELARRGARVFDCQVYTEHVAAAGGEEIGREEYLRLLKSALPEDTLDDLWVPGREIGLRLYDRIGAAPDSLRESR